MKSNFLQRIGFIAIICSICTTSCGKKTSSSTKSTSDKNSSQITNKNTQLNNKTDYKAYQDSIQKLINDHKSHFDSLFINKKGQQSFKEISDYGEIWIGNLFNEINKYAILVYQTTDSTMNIDVLKEREQKWDTILHHTSESYFEEIMLADGVIDISDFNGDNQVDLRIIHEYWHIHPGEHSMLWIFRNGNFEYVKDFDQITSPQYDKKTNKIYSYQSDGCADMDMQFFVYKLNGLQAIEVDDIFCECCDCDSGSCTITRKGQSKSITIDKLHLSFPEYFREMIKHKTELCRK